MPKADGRRIEGAYSDHYNIAAIRELIKNAFMLKELPRFCRDRPLFRPVLTYLHSHSCLEDMADVLIEYCQTRLLLPELLSEIKELNPRQYGKHSTQLHTPAYPEEGGSIDCSSRNSEGKEYDVNSPQSIATHIKDASDGRDDHVSEVIVVVLIVDDESAGQGPLSHVTTTSCRLAYAISMSNHPKVVCA